MSSIIIVDDQATNRNLFARLARSISAFEEEFPDREGEPLTVLTTKSPLQTSADTITAVLTTSIDISDRKQAEAHLHHITHHDTLTGLPNRVLLQEHLTAIAESWRVWAVTNSPCWMGQVEAVRGRDLDWRRAGGKIRPFG